MKRIINKWHSYLDMPKYDLEWHQRDISDELQELKEARGLINIWSEISDIVYTYTRAHWSGHENIILPISKTKYFIGLLYMFPKYTLRWRFYLVLGKNIDKNLEFREVRNPHKIEKIGAIAEKYNLDKDLLILESNKLINKWFFLK